MFLVECDRNIKVYTADHNLEHNEITQPDKNW